MGESFPFLCRRSALEINPAAMEVVSYQNSLIGLPFAISGVVMYRNLSIIPEYPNTIIDMISFSQAATKGRVIGAYLERGALYAFPQMTACGGMLLNSNGYPAFNNSTGLCWFEVLRSFEEAGPTSFNSDDDIARFSDGRVGMIFEGTWNAERLYENLGENLVIDPWPEYKVGHLSGYVWTENVYMNPNTNEDDIKAAIAFSEFLLTPGTQAIFAQVGKIPSILNLDIEDPMITQSMAALSRGTPFPVISEMQFYWEPMHAALKAVLLGGADPLNVLQTTSDAIIQNITNSMDSQEVN